MGLNTNKIARGYNKVARKLGDLYGLYRVSDYEATIATHPRNWIKDVYFSPSNSESYQSPEKLGLNQFLAYVDFRELQAGDIFVHDTLGTYYIGEIRSFEMPITIRCYNTFTCEKRSWDKATRTYIEEITANTIPCNIQRVGAMSDPNVTESYSHPDAIKQWSIETWLPNGILNINDELTLDTGERAQVSDLFYHGQGLTIQCKEIRVNPDPIE